MYPLAAACSTTKSEETPHSFLRRKLQSIPSAASVLKLVRLDAGNGHWSSFGQFSKGKSSLICTPPHARSAPSTIARTVHSCPSRLGLGRLTTRTWCSPAARVKGAPSASRPSACSCVTTCGIASAFCRCTTSSRKAFCVATYVSVTACGLGTRTAAAATVAPLASRTSSWPRPAMKASARECSATHTSRAPASASTRAQSTSAGSRSVG